MSEQRNVPCGLCRYQHKRHDLSCEFGQYFPINRLREIESASKFFGMANLLRLMRGAEPSQRQVMANSILREAQMWANDPIHGALGHILTLSSHIKSVGRELKLVNAMLAHCSHQATPQIATTVQDNLVASSSNPAQSSTVASQEKEGAAEEKDAEVKRKNGKRKH
ncbi:LOB domain-containing protein 9-like [Phaseolus vulgaris]